jgi:hypothetical protein
MMSVPAQKKSVEDQYDEFRKLLSDFDSLHFLIQNSGENAHIAYSSESLNEYLGYAAKDLLGKDVSILRDNEMKSETIESAQRYGHEVVTEVVNKSREGTSHRTKVSIRCESFLLSCRCLFVKWLQVHLLPILDNHGFIVFFLQIFDHLSTLDVTGLDDASHRLTGLLQVYLKGYSRISLRQSRFLTEIPHLKVSTSHLIAISMGAILMQGRWVSARVGPGICGGGGGLDGGGFCGWMRWTVVLCGGCKPSGLPAGA